MSMRNLLSALLFSFALSLLHLNATSPAVVAGESIYQHDWPQLVWSGQFEWESSHMPLTPPGASGYACIQADCEPQKPLTDYSYSELQHALLRKIWWQSKSLSLSALGVSSNWLDAGWSHLIAGFKALIGLTLTMIIAVWSSAIMVFCTVTFWITWNYLTQILRMCLLGVITFYISKGIQWIFGGLFWQMLQLMYALTQRTPSCYDKKKEIQEEQAVEGHIPVIIKQNPPKNAQVLVVHPDGSLAGYATCVRLFNGGLGLITSTHVLKNNHFQSTKTGNRIPTSAFKHLIQGEDLSILRGPPNFESILGCKGVNMVSVKHLGPGPLCHYRYRKSVWEQSSGQLTGSVQGLGIVLSTTDKGDSGASYWNGKNVLGVHRGHPIGENMNILVPIPAVPGITVPVYVYETTAPTGKLFSESEVEEYTSKYTLDLIHKLDDFVPKSGKYWADVVEETTPPPAEQILKPHHSCRRVCEKHENETCTLAYGSFYPCCICYKADQAAGKRERQSCLPKQQQPPGGAQDENGRGDHPSLARTDDVGYPPTEGDCSYGEQDQHGRNQQVRGGSSNPAQAGQTRREEEAANYRRWFNEKYDWQPGKPLQIPGFREVGKFRHRYHAPRKEESDWGRQLVGAYPALESKTAGFGWPQFGPEAEITSLRLQAHRWLERAKSATIPEGKVRLRIIEETVEAYHAVRTQHPRLFDKEGRLYWPEFLESFKRAIESLEFDAGVGVPYISYGKPTHRYWVEDPDLLPVLARLTFDRLQKLSEARLEDYTPERLVQEGLCDPIRLFVKGEPHKQAKLDEGRYRLIMSVSLVDQLVARVLFQDQNKTEIALWRAIPSKPGFGLSSDSQAEEFVELIARTVGVSSQELVSSWKDYVIPTDCSGFDWSVADWMLKDEMAVRNRLTIGCTPELERLRLNWLHCLSNSVLCLSDGTLIAQEVPGVQKSGSYNTSSSNSRIRYMAARHCGASWAVAMGDDALESINSDLEGYRRLGFKVEVSDRLEFCSHVFEQPNLAVPVNVNRMFYKLVYGYNPGSGNLEVVANYLNACISVLWEVRHDPALVSLLHECLIAPVEAQKIPREAV
nr:P1-P2 fusion protein [Grapevine polerovirus 1]UYT09255.1 P1-P2 fusion protein [Grapevine polerovirus 1]